jgi:hypothetical protein
VLVGAGGTRRKEGRGDKSKKASARLERRMANDKSESNGNAGGGCGLGTVQTVFIILKLAKAGSVANWPWWLVMAPTWGACGLSICCVGCGMGMLCCNQMIFGPEEDTSGGPPAEMAMDGRPVVV